jgi:hypothetical protein
MNFFWLNLFLSCHALFLNFTTTYLPLYQPVPKCRILLPKCRIHFMPLILALYMKIDKHESMKSFNNNFLKRKFYGHDKFLSNPENGEEIFPADIHPPLPLNAPFACGGNMEG